MKANIHSQKSDMTSSLSDKILEKIEKDKIEPSSKLKLKIQNDGFWILWFISIIIGATAVAGTLFVVLNSDWKFYSATYGSFFAFVFDTLPYVWILAILVFLLLAHQNIRHTKYGYRYPLVAILGLSMAASLLGGVALYVFGLGEIIDENIGKHIPLYQPSIENQQQKWTDPANGLLAGQVTYLAPDFSSFELLGFDGRKWTVTGEDLLHIDHLILAQNDIVKVVGVPTTAPSSTPVVFHACLVFPWMKPVDSFPNERNITRDRSNQCKGVRPYQLLQELQNEAQ